jgi:uridylate kinase
MSAIIEAIAESTLRGRNAVVTSISEVGTVGKVLTTLDAVGMNVGYLNLAQSAAGIYLGSQCHIGNEIWLKKADEFLEAEVIVLDRGSHISINTLDVVRKLMSHRIVYDTYLPNVKSVVVVFTEDPQGSAKKLSALPNTMSVNLN